MTAAAQTVIPSFTRSLRVGDRVFEGRLWREALTHFMTGIWSGNAVRSGQNLSITFINNINEEITLTLDTDRETLTVEGAMSSYGYPRPRARNELHYTHDVRRGRVDTMDMLMCLMHDEHIDSITLSMETMKNGRRGCRQFLLQKVPGHRGQLEIYLAHH